MLDFSLIREKKNILIENLINRGFDKESAQKTVDNLMTMDKEHRSLLWNMQDKQHKKNLIVSDSEISVEEKKKQTLSLSENILELEQQVESIKEKLYHAMLALPNILSPQVPYGKNAEDNKEIRKSFINRDYIEIKPHYELLDNTVLEQVISMAGSRFIGLKGKIAQLYRSLSTFLLNHLAKAGYTEVYLPFILNNNSFIRSGHIPHFSDLFWLSENKMGLIPTSEASLVNFFAKRNLSSLPVKVCSFSPCFRKEAGSAGKDTKGMIRLHQFQKVEMFQVTSAEESDHALEEMVNVVEEVLNELNIPYRVVLLCSGDTGFCASKTYDIEVYMPSRHGYVEISSCSNCTDFQSRRSKIKGPNKEFAHLLNGSCLPLERLLAVIMEIYQENNEILIPKALRKYLSFDKISSEELYERI